MKAEVLYTHSKVYTDRSRVHKGAQVLVSQPVGLSFHQSVNSRLVGGSVIRSVGSSVGRLVSQTVRYYLQLANIEVHLLFTGSKTAVD